MHEVRGLEDVLGAVRYWEEDYGRTVVLELPKLRRGQRLVIANLSVHTTVVVDRLVEMRTNDRLEYEQGPRRTDFLLLCDTGL